MELLSGLCVPQTLEQGRLLAEQEGVSWLPHHVHNPKTIIPHGIIFTRTLVLSWTAVQHHLRTY
jgi:hypothetical protein